MEQAEQEKRVGSSQQRDGAKLSFQEKMKLFASEAEQKAGGGGGQKAKTSRVQRDLEAEPPTSLSSQHDSQ